MNAKRRRASRSPAFLILVAFVAKTKDCSRSLAPLCAGLPTRTPPRPQVSQVRVLRPRCVRVSPRCVRVSRPAHHRDRRSPKCVSCVPAVCGSPDPHTTATAGLPSACPASGDLRSDRCSGRETGTQRRKRAAFEETGTQRPILGLGGQGYGGCAEFPLDGGGRTPLPPRSVATQSSWTLPHSGSRQSYTVEAVSRLHLAPRALSW